MTSDATRARHQRMQQRMKEALSRKRMMAGRNEEEAPKEQPKESVDTKVTVVDVVEAQKETVELPEGEGLVYSPSTFTEPVLEDTKVERQSEAPVQEAALNGSMEMMPPSDEEPSPEKQIPGTPKVSNLESQRAIPVNEHDIGQMKLVSSVAVESSQEIDKEVEEDTIGTTTDQGSDEEDNLEGVDPQLQDAEPQEEEVLVKESGKKLSKKSRKKKRSKRRYNAKAYDGDESSSDDSREDPRTKVFYTHKAPSVTSALEDVFDFISPFEDDLRSDDEESVRSENWNEDPKEKEEKDSSIFGSFFPTKDVALFKEVEKMITGLGCTGPDGEMTIGTPTGSYSFQEDDTVSEQEESKEKDPSVNALPNTSVDSTEDVIKALTTDILDVSNVSTPQRPTCDVACAVADDFVASVQDETKNQKSTIEDVLPSVKLDETFIPKGFSAEAGFANIQSTLKETSDRASKVFDSIKEQTDAVLIQSVESEEEAIQTVQSADTQSVHMTTDPDLIYSPARGIDQVESFLSYEDDTAYTSVASSSYMQDSRVTLDSFQDTFTKEASKVAQEVQKAISKLQGLEKMSSLWKPSEEVKSETEKVPKQVPELKTVDSIGEEPIELSLEDHPGAIEEADPQIPPISNEIEESEESEQPSQFVHEELPSTIPEDPEELGSVDADESGDQVAASEDADAVDATEAEVQVESNEEVAICATSLPTMTESSPDKTDDEAAPEGADETHSVTKPAHVEPIVEPVATKAEQVVAVSQPEKTVTVETPSKSVSVPATKAAPTKKGKLRRLSKLVSPLFKRGKSKRKSKVKDEAQMPLSAPSTPIVTKQGDSVYEMMSDATHPLSDRESPVVSTPKKEYEFGDFDQMVSKRRDDNWHVISDFEAKASTVPASPNRADTEDETPESEDITDVASLYSAATGAWDEPENAGWFPLQDTWKDEKVDVLDLGASS
eukprot:Nitzschia sp. Nitz4//scaffold89_size161592//151865//154711//NITZ4_002405-RA/size161592-processed-gene-0.64-mRNA-1//-1//CDS//3329559697//5713//frame0